LHVGDTIVGMQSNINILHDWLNRRGITQDVIDMFGISSFEHPQIGECIRIPISNTHNKYRRHPLDERKPKYLYDSGGKVTLYGLSHLTAVHTHVLITEGEADCLVAWSNNIPAVTSTGGAMSFQEEWATLLAPYDVTLCFDNDDAGAEGMVRVLKYLPQAKVLLLPERTGLKDISDYVAQGGDLHQLMANARQYLSMEDVLEDRDKRKGILLPIRFHNAYVDAHRQKEERATNTTTDKYTGTDRVLRAKSYPLQNLIPFTRNKAVCPWHHEKTPSLAYYPKTNSAYCFGACGKPYDSIEAYRLLHNCSFKKAVDELNKLV
jgi:DNA primase